MNYVLYHTLCFLQTAEKPVGEILSMKPDLKDHSYPVVMHFVNGQQYRAKKKKVIIVVILVYKSQHHLGIFTVSSLDTLI